MKIQRTTEQSSPDAWEDYKTDHKENDLGVL